jgi:hypothetical protein
MAQSIDQTKKELSLASQILVKLCASMVEARLGAYGRMVQANG